jgi:predicted CoA-binding protein
VDQKMMDAVEILRHAHRIVLHDWPDEDVPDSLALAGFDVTCYGGPAPDDVFRHEVIDGVAVSRKTGVPPAAADLVYVFRPIEELPQLLQAAQNIGATTIWRQSGLNPAGEKDPRGSAPSPDSAQWRSTVETAGLRYIEGAYIGDIAREVMKRRDAEGS